MVVNKLDNNEDFDEKTNDDNDGVVDDTGEDYIVVLFEFNSIFEAKTSKNCTFGLVIMRRDFIVIEDDNELDDVD